MKNPKKALSYLLFLPMLVTAAGCSGSNTAKPTNEMSFPLDSITEVTIAYDEENITFFPGDGDRLIVMEYMNKDKSSYHAKVTQRDGVIHISEGSKPRRRGGFYRYVEVYLPAGYRGTLITTTTSGNIDLTGLDVAVGTFHADSTSGKIAIGTVSADSVKLTTTSGEITCGILTGEVYLETKSGSISVQSAEANSGLFQAITTSGSYELGSVTAEQVEIKTTSGSVECEEMSGQINYTTTSGDLSIRSANGSGSFEASNQGKIEVGFTQVTGDLTLNNKNDSIHLVLPADLSFHFEGITRNGSIETNFGSQLQMSGDSLTGDVGDAPIITVRVETREGAISVTQ